MTVTIRPSVRQWIGFVLLSSTLALCPSPSDALEIAVTFDKSESAEPLDGRVLLLIATDTKREPRFQVSGRISSAQVFGVDVDGLKPGEAAVIGSGVFGYPLRDLSELSPGEYYVQALLHKYETFHVAHGHTLKLPMDRGEGQQWKRAPGNLYSEPRKMRLDPASDKRVRIRLDKVIPPIKEPEDTKYIKHVKIRSKVLSEFWGRPMHLGAHVLVPEGFDEHPEAHYPLMIFHGHFPADFGGFRTEPPDPRPRARVQRALRRRGLQRFPAAGGLRLLSQMDQP